MRVGSVVRRVLQVANGDPSGFYAKALMEDWLSGRYSVKESVWALRHGFAPSTVRFLGINASNVSDYLSDQDYFAAHPYNRWSVLRINDKYSIRYALSKYKQYLPDYYALFHSGRVCKLPDWPEDRIPFQGGGGVFSIVEKLGRVVVKRLGGSGGEGFSRVELGERTGSLVVNGIEIAADDYYSTLISSGSEFVMTEEVRQCHKYQQAWPDVCHCIRIQTASTPSGSRILFNFVRFGGAGQDWCTGHTLGGSVFGEVDSRGSIEAVYRFEDGAVRRYSEHPDTGVRITGKVPNWNLICEKCLEMHEYLSDLDYLGWDIAATDEGFTILEVNSLSAISPVQFFHPIRRDEELNRFFS